MRCLAPTLMLLACTAFLFAPPPAAALFGDDTLIVLDGERYSADDFRRWWKFWKEEDTPLPKTPEPYIDWLLLSREGERMDLASDPSFRRQSEVFLKSRALLMLKYDAVNSRISVSEEAIKERYARDYLPRWLVQRLEFRDDAAAAAAWQALSEGGTTVGELAARAPEEGGPVLQRETWLRPRGIDPGWAEIFRRLDAGAVVDPGEHNQGRVLFHLKERKEGDGEDLAAMREGIRRELWKEQENALTLALLSDLREKYRVQVDADRIAALDLNAADATFTDTPVLTTSRQNVSEKDFVLILRRHLRSRAAAVHALMDAEETQKLKNEVVGGIIAQNVTDWEALDRHYEEREPFKWEYDFHVRHRLSAALEEKLFAPGAVVSEEEIRRHYEENIERYTQPALVKLFIIDDTQGPVEEVRADTLVGVPFVTAVRNRFGRGIAPQEIPANHIDPEVRAVVDALAVGETSPVFTAQGSRVVAHLLERTPAAPLPLERVSGAIRTRLTREKIERQRSEYLEALKSRSKIEIRNRQWKAIQKELGGV